MLNVKGDRPRSYCFKYFTIFKVIPPENLSFYKFNQEKSAMVEKDLKVSKQKKWIASKWLKMQLTLQP